jgi:hypothetical protein
VNSLIYLEKKMSSEQTKAKKLNGDRNQCQGYLEYFNSSHAFDKHRTGEHGVDRRCMNHDEMKAKGMFLGDDGFWRGSAMPEKLYKVTA